MEFNSLVNYNQNADGFSKNNLIIVSSDFKLINIRSAMMVHMQNMLCVKQVSRNHQFNNDNN